MIFKILLSLVPSSPILVSETNISSFIVEIKWSKPDKANGIILSYKLSYKKHSDTNYTDIDVSAETLSKNITSLGKYKCHSNSAELILLC